MSTQGFKRTLATAHQILSGLFIMNLAFSHRGPAPDPAAHEKGDERAGFPDHQNDD